MGPLCYFYTINFVTIYFTVQVSRISKCSQIISASTYFMGTLFLSRHVIFLYILLEKLLSFSSNLPSVNHKFQEREVEPDWSP